MRENVAFSSNIRPKRVASFIEDIERSTEWIIRRFENKSDHKAQLKADRDFETVELYTEREALDLFAAPQKTIINGNLLLNEGINELFTIFASASSGTKFSSANAYIGVGDSTTAASASQTGLQAATNKLYKGMDATYPTYGTAQKATYRSTFGASDAKFAWNEFTLANGNSDSAKNLCRKVAASGTKLDDQIWDISYEIGLE